jgi:hypothetical protein
LFLLVGRLLRLGADALVELLPAPSHLRDQPHLRKPLVTARPLGSLDRPGPLRAAVPLIDVLKETVLRTGCLQTVISAAGGTPSKAPIWYLNVRVRDELGREACTVQLDPERAPLIERAYKAYASGPARIG